MTELQIVLAELGALRTDLGARIDRVGDALVHHIDQDREKHAAIDGEVDELKTMQSRWKGAAQALAAAWGVLVAAAGIWFAMQQAGAAP